MASKPKATRPKATRAKAKDNRKKANLPAAKHKRAKVTRQSEDTQTRPEEEAEALIDSKSSQSPFLNLPAELRNRIYEYALTIPTGLDVGPVHARCEGDKHCCAGRLEIFKTPDSKEDWALGLLETNKQIRREAEPIVYSCNHFVFDSFTHLDEVLCFVGLDMARRIRSITVEDLPDPDDLLIHSLSRDCLDICRNMPSIDILAFQILTQEEVDERSQQWADIYHKQVKQQHRSNRLSPALEPLQNTRLESWNDQKGIDRSTIYIQWPAKRTVIRLDGNREGSDMTKQSETSSPRSPYKYESQDAGDSMTSTNMAFWYSPSTHER
ncbi:hypothetical protein EJ05DRAFT_540042 [Pseudovirgaria hyperparasitica]|uniref:DUF7730 domain-containing protein n=1 Tax=Pseudovirgaria hyperparasitica TaxID=470096 RepID=A0A6A6W2U3_9PEZI|nr:uncharacterized protein EJ05DRAFT_540042 [Pseudovirgaria hyperparasitica]KAF2756280.1 hypothetical protein EJ05DRAFT_540042 [Pseudovirgaria hyperparasitica]